MLSLILESDGYDELVDRTEYLERIHGMDEAVVGRVRDLRDEVKDTVARLRSAKNRIEAARDAIAAEEQALAAPARRSSSASRRSSRPAPIAERAREDQRNRGRPRRLRRRDPERTGGDAGGYGSVPLPAGPIVPGNGSGLIWPVERRRRLRLRHALGPDARGDRHRRARRHPDPGRGIRDRDPGPERSGKRRLRQLHLPRPRRRALQTCYAHQSAFAVSSGQSVPRAT